MKRLLTTLLLAWLLSVTVSCDKNDNDQEPPIMPIKNLVMPDESTPRLWGKQVTIQGEGFISTSRILIGESAKKEATIAEHTPAGITFVVPEGIEGLQNVTLQQGGKDWPLGRLRFAKPTPEVRRGIVSMFEIISPYEGDESYEFSIEYDADNNITKIAAPTTFEDGSVYNYLRQGDKLIVTHAWSDTPDEPTDETFEASLDAKGRIVTAKETWYKDFDDPHVTNYRCHYSDNGEITVYSGFYGQAKFTWKDGNILGSEYTDDEAKFFAQQVSSPYENRTNVDFSEILGSFLYDIILGVVMPDALTTRMLRSVGCLGNMDKNLPQKVTLTEESTIVVTYSYEFNDNDWPTSITIDYEDLGRPGEGDDQYINKLVVKISYKN